jgi:hypothetical protein
VDEGSGAAELQDHPAEARLTRLAVAAPPGRRPAGGELLSIFQNSCYVEIRFSKLSAGAREALRAGWDRKNQEMVFFLGFHS